MSIADAAQEVAAMPTDPVCGMQVKEEAALTADYDGRTFYFDSDDCREEFLETPDDYVEEIVEMSTEDEF